MTHYYADLNNVALTLKRLVGKPNPQGNLQVLDVEARIAGADRDEMQERNLLTTKDVGDNICQIRWSGAGDSRGPITLEISFHENELMNTFCFSQSGGDYSRLAELSDRLKKVELQMSGTAEMQLDEEVQNWWGRRQAQRKQHLGLPRPDFAEIDSASVATHFDDGLADREFKYEVLAELSTFSV